VVTDFGTSNIPKSGSVTTVKDAMSRLTSSIEQLELEDAHSSSDIWSCGIILYILMAKKEPSTQLSVVKRQKKIKQIHSKKLSEEYSKELRDLVDYLLTEDKGKRPTIEQVLRYPIIRRELDNILKDLVPLTYNYSTAMSAHSVLEQVIEIQCMLAKSTDYGLAVTDPSLLRVANTPDTQFLLQAELRAIH
jgi:serine/threonine protein kinase